MFITFLGFNYFDNKYSQDQSVVSLKTVALFTKADSLRQFHVLGKKRKCFWAGSSTQPDQIAKQMLTGRTFTVVYDLGIFRQFYLLAINVLILGRLMSVNYVPSAMH